MMKVPFSIRAWRDSKNAGFLSAETVAPEANNFHSPRHSRRIGRRGGRRPRAGLVNQGKILPCRAEFAGFLQVRRRATDRVSKMTSHFINEFKGLASSAKFSQALAYPLLNGLRNEVRQSN